MDKLSKTLVIGISLFISGILLRYWAFRIAWPKSWKFNIPREHTNWAIYETSLADISLWIAVLGGAIILMSFWVYLNEKEAVTHYI